MLSQYISIGFVGLVIMVVGMIAGRDGITIAGSVIAGSVVISVAILAAGKY